MGVGDQGPVYSITHTVFSLVSTLHKQPRNTANLLQQPLVPVMTSVSATHESGLAKHGEESFVKPALVSGGWRAVGQDGAEQAQGQQLGGETAVPAGVPRLHQGEGELKPGRGAEGAAERPGQTDCADEAESCPAAVLVPGQQQLLPAAPPRPAAQLDGLPQYPGTLLHRAALHAVRL